MSLPKRTLWLLAIVILLALTQATAWGTERRVQPTDTPGQVAETQAIYGELQEECNHAIARVAKRVETLARTVFTVAKALVKVIQTVVVVVGTLVVRFVVTILVMVGAWMLHAILPV